MYVGICLILGGLFPYYVLSAYQMFLLIFDTGTRLYSTGGKVGQSTIVFSIKAK